MSTLNLRDAKLIENWYIAALSTDVTEHKPFACTLYDEPLVIFREASGTPKTLQDRCIHRGTKLSKGHCSKVGITCPYHGWTFGSEGEVISIPSEGPENDKLSTRSQNKAWKVQAYPTVEQDGVIWVWMGRGEPKTAAPPWRFPYFGDKKWTQYFMVTDFENEVGHLVQNFMDVPHTVFVHDKWFREKKWMNVPYDLETSQGRVKATYHKPLDTIGGFMNRVINPDRKPMEHIDEFIYPNITRVDYRFGSRGFVINSQCSPVSEFKTRVYTWITYRGSFIAPMLKPLMRYYTRKVITQDVEIMQNQGSNLQRFKDAPVWVSTAADEIHIAIERLRTQGQMGKFETQATASNKERSFWI